MTMGNKMEWLKWPLEHYSISLLIIGILFVLGIFGMWDMPKDEFPHATIRQGVVVAVYPGATSEEVEQQVARPLERYLFTYGEVNRVKCIMMVKLNDDVNNKDEVWSKIKHGLNGFKAQLPSGVLAIVVNDDFGNTSALLIAIESSQRNYRELKQYSDDLSDRLRRIPSVANVKLFGEQKEQISLYVDRQRLQAYGIGQQMLFSRLQAQGITTMAGSMALPFPPPCLGRNCLPTIRCCSSMPTAFSYRCSSRPFFATTCCSKGWSLRSLSSGTSLQSIATRSSFVAAP